jgi:hypothetical protein
MLALKYTKARNLFLRRLFNSDYPYPGMATAKIEQEGRQFALVDLCH